MEAVKEAIVAQLENKYVLIGAVVLGLVIATYVYFKVFGKTEATTTEEFVPQEQHYQEQPMEQEQQQEQEQPQEQSYE